MIGRRIGGVWRLKTGIPVAVNSVLWNADNILLIVGGRAANAARRATSASAMMRALSLSAATSLAARSAFISMRPLVISCSVISK
jgi:hypothetical protein